MANKTSEPFKAPITLELASRYYRQIIRVFGTADRFIKPAWPLLWQTLEIFRVSGFKEPQYLVPKEDFGSFKRTLDAYLAAYHCDDVDWEINWKTRFAPEFRLLPAKRGAYSTLQLLAVLRALRYNDYFNSLSFRDIDLSVLCGLQDNTPRKVNVAYLTRTCKSDLACQACLVLTPLRRRSRARRNRDVEGQPRAAPRVPRACLLFPDHPADRLWELHPVILVAAGAAEEPGPQPPVSYTDSQLDAVGHHQVQPLDCQRQHAAPSRR